MSRCAHAQSLYKLAEMPQCLKCKTELVLTYAMYDDTKELVKEWECPRCGRISSLTQVKEPRFSGEDIWLSEWCKKNSKK